MENPIGVQSNVVSCETASKIDQATSEVRSKRGGDRRSSAFKNSKGMASSSGQPSGEPKVEVSEADIEMVAAMFTGGLKIVDGFMTRYIFSTVIKIDASMEPKAKELADHVSVTPEEYQLVEMSARSIAVKYAFMSRFAAEIALGGFCVEYGLRCKQTVSEVRDLVAVVAKIRGIKNSDIDRPSANSPSAN